MLHGIRNNSGEPMVNMEDVAQRAKVSKATVSRVFNGNPNVSSKTRDRVLAACSDLHYKLNSSIQDLLKKSRSGFTSNVAFVLVGRDFSDPAYVELVNPIAEESIKRHLHLMLVKLTGCESSIYDLPPALRDERVDGILLSGNIQDGTTALLEQRISVPVRTQKGPAAITATGPSHCVL